MQKANDKREDTHLNLKIERIARRDKKAFLGDHCKKREGKNRMGNN